MLCRFDSIAILFEMFDDVCLDFFLEKKIKQNEQRTNSIRVSVSL